MLTTRCRAAGIKDEEVRGGGKRRKAAELRAKIAYYCCTEMGIPMAEIARHFGVGTSAIAMAIRKQEREG